METKRREWYRHNALQPGRPLLLVYPEGSWAEILPASVLQCEDLIAREVEYKLLARILQHDVLRDDMVFEPEFLVPKIIDYATFLPEGTVYRTTTFHFHTGLVRPVEGWELDPVSGFIPSLWEPQRAAAADRGDRYEKMLTGIRDLETYRTPRVSYRETETREKFEIIRDCIGSDLDVRVAGQRFQFRKSSC